MINITKIDNKSDEVNMLTFNPHNMLKPLSLVGDALMDQSHAPAYIIEVDHDGRSAVFAEGVAKLGTKEAVRASNTFEIGSQTKMMTAALTLKLADRGEIDLDAKIAEYLPTNLLHDIPNAGKATVRQLLDMTAGIPNYTEKRGPGGQPLFIEKLLAGEKFGPTEALEVARDMKPTGVPGDQYHYSNTNYLLLGLLLERQTGQSLASLFEEQIFRPLGMNHSTARATGVGDPRLNSYTAFGNELIDVTDAPWYFKGEAGVVSTTGDMIRFLQALTTPGGLLSSEALEQMMGFQVTARENGYTTSFGLGLAKIDFDNGESFVGFTGGTLGTSSSTYISLKTGAVISLVGTAGDFESDDGAFALLQILEDTPAWTAAGGPGMPVVKDASAAATALLKDHDDLMLAVDGARIDVQVPIRDLVPADIRFADGSILLIGDGKRGGTDQRGNLIDLSRDRPGADGKANHLIGLGGDDRIFGGDGDEWLEGNRGNDHLSGRAGDDLIDGGAGRDMLRGGIGSDQFVFRSGRAANGDMIRDFQSSIDRIDLSAIDAVPKGRDSAFHWLGDQAFDGRCGALHFTDTRSGVTVSGDIDGDRKADFHISIDELDHLTRSDFLF